MSELQKITRAFLWLFDDCLSGEVHIDNKPRTDNRDILRALVEGNDGHHFFHEVTERQGITLHNRHLLLKEDYYKEVTIEGGTTYLFRGLMSGDPVWKEKIAGNKFMFPLLNNMSGVKENSLIDPCKVEGTRYALLDCKLDGEPVIYLEGYKGQTSAGMERFSKIGITYFDDPTAKLAFITTLRLELASDMSKEAATVINNIKALNLDFNGEVSATILTGTSDFKSSLLGDRTSVMTKTLMSFLSEGYPASSLSDKLNNIEWTASSTENVRIHFMMDGEPFEATIKDGQWESGYTTKTLPGKFPERRATARFKIRMNSPELTGLNLFIASEIKLKGNLYGSVRLNEPDKSCKP